MRGLKHTEIILEKSEKLKYQKSTLSAKIALVHFRHLEFFLKGSKTLSFIPALTTIKGIANAKKRVPDYDHRRLRFHEDVEATALLCAQS